MPASLFDACDAVLVRRISCRGGTRTKRPSLLSSRRLKSSPKWCDSMPITRLLIVCAFVSAGIERRQVGRPVSEEQGLCLSLLVGFDTCADSNSYQSRVLRTKWRIFESVLLLCFCLGQVCSCACSATACCWIKAFSRSRRWLRSVAACSAKCVPGYRQSSALLASQLKAEQKDVARTLVSLVRCHPSLF